MGENEETILLYSTAFIFDFAQERFSDDAYTIDTVPSYKLLCRVCSLSSIFF